MNKLVVCLVLVGLLFSPLVSCGCGKFKGKKGTYDTDPLTSSTSSPYTASEVGTTFEYYWNFCQNLVGSPPYAANLPNPSPTLQYDSEHSLATSIGYGSPVISETGDGLKFVYSNTVDKCKDGSGIPNIDRITTIQVKCDSKAENAANLRVSEPTGTKCQYLIELTHKAACPSGGGLSGGSVFLIIFFVGFAVYFIAGIIFKKVRNNATGVELIPNVEFWQGLPGLIVDGFRFVVSKFRGGGYASV